MNQSSNRTLREGWIALFLFVLVVAVWLFPIPVVIYCAYISLFFGVIDMMRPRLLVLLATWSRVILAGVVSLGIFGIFLVRSDFIDFHELRPHTFSSVTLLMVGGWLFWLVVDALRRLWKGSDHKSLLGSEQAMRMILFIVIISVLVAFLLVRKWQQASELTSDPIVYQVWDETKPLHRIDPSGLEVLQEGPFTLYFPPQHKNQAEEVARALSQGWQIVKRRLSLDLGDFGVILVPLRDNMGGVFIERWEKEPVPQPVVGSMNWQKLSEAPLPTRYSVYVALPHEAAHHVLRFEGRWLEEGLAEYIGYLVAQELDPQVLQRSLMTRQAEVRALIPQATYDLTSDPPAQFIVRGNKRIKHFSPVEVAGYGVSLAFWLQIAQRHGEEVIRRFLERTREQRGVQELAQILTELTGEEIWSKLRQIDLLEVLRTLEQAAEVPVRT